MTLVNYKPYSAQISLSNIMDKKSLYKEINQTKEIKATVIRSLRNTTFNSVVVILELNKDNIEFSLEINFSDDIECSSFLKYYKIPITVPQIDPNSDKSGVGISKITAPKIPY